MPMELRPLARRLSLRRTEIDGVRVHSGTIGGRDVVAIVTGIGPRLATAGITRLLEAVDVERVVVVGIAGAVENVTPIGTLVLPEVVVDGSTGAEYQHAPLGDGTTHGKMRSTDGLTTDLDVVSALRAQGVVALDMETAAIAEVCEQRGIPWSVFRAISDRASDGSIDDEVFGMSNADGTANARAVARFFLRHPGRVLQMARLARGARLATETAADAAISACSPT
jgi:adenosylhomocysteine nucleosidase